jgi:hypothetical protein
VQWVLRVFKVLREQLESKALQVHQVLPGKLALKAHKVLKVYKVLKAHKVL